MDGYWAYSDLLTPAPGSPRRPGTGRWTGRGGPERTPASSPCWSGRRRSPSARRRGSSPRYARLLDLNPSPVVRLNHAVAPAMVRGPEAGPRLLVGLDAELGDYHYRHAARGELLRLAGDRPAARAAVQRALALVGNEPERRLLRARLAAPTAGTGPAARGQPTGLPAVQSAQLRFQSPKPSVAASGTSVPVTRTASPRPKLS